MNEIIKGVKDIESGYSMGNNEIQMLCGWCNAIRREWTWFLEAFSMDS